MKFHKRYKKMVISFFGWWKFYKHGTWQLFEITCKPIHSRLNLWVLHFCLIHETRWQLNMITQKNTWETVRYEVCYFKGNIFIKNCVAHFFLMDWTFVGCVKLIPWELVFSPTLCDSHPPHTLIFSPKMFIQIKHNSIVV